MLKSLLITGLLLSSGYSFAELKNVDEDIRKSIVFNVDEKKVWEVLTDSVELAKWWGKGVKLEPAVGGQFYEPWGDGQLATGVVTAVKLGESISFTWREKTWKASESTLCTFLVKKSDSGTRLEVIHSGWESIKDLGDRKDRIHGFKKGWDFLLNKLTNHLKDNGV